MKPLKKPRLTSTQQEAVERVKKAGVKADQFAILSFVRHVGSHTILKSSLAEIKKIADAF